MSLQITVDEKSGSKILRIDGRLDAVSSTQFDESLTKVDESSQNVFVDFSKVEYLSSAGMRVMLAHSKKMSAKQGKLVFFQISEEVMEIIKMAGFEKILTIRSSESQALAS
jgi:anti-sigma B factor antagonist/stage II sporulation protein AA (anti-sigma F factor antagonist)